MWKIQFYILKVFWEVCFKEVKTEKTSSLCASVSKAFQKCVCFSLHSWAEHFEDIYVKQKCPQVVLDLVEKEIISSSFYSEIPVIAVHSTFRKVFFLCLPSGVSLVLPSALLSLLISLANLLYILNKRVCLFFFFFFYSLWCWKPLT